MFRSRKIVLIPEYLKFISVDNKFAIGINIFEWKNKANTLTHLFRDGYDALSKMNIFNQKISFMGWECR